MRDHPLQQRQSRGDDREQSVRARQAAEALFTSKQDVAERPFPELSQAPHPRKPRILPILPPAPIRQQTVDAPVPPEQRHAPEIPVKKRARVRTLVSSIHAKSSVSDGVAAAAIGRTFATGLKLTQFRVVSRRAL